MTYLAQYQATLSRPFGGSTREIPNLRKRPSQTRERRAPASPDWMSPCTWRSPLRCLSHPRKPVARTVFALIWRATECSALSGYFGFGGRRKVTVRNQGSQGPSTSEGSHSERAVRTSWLAIEHTSPVKDGGRGVCAASPGPSEGTIPPPGGYKGQSAPWGSPRRPPRRPHPKGPVRLPPEGYDAP